MLRNETYSDPFFERGVRPLSGQRGTTPSGMLSGRRDSNSRSSAPKADAVTKLGHSPRSTSTATKNRTLQTEGWNLSTAPAAAASLTINVSSPKRVRSKLARSNGHGLRPTAEHREPPGSDCDRGKRSIGRWIRTTICGAKTRCPSLWTIPMRARLQPANSENSETKPTLTPFSKKGSDPFRAKGVRPRRKIEAWVDQRSR